MSVGEVPVGALNVPGEGGYHGPCGIRRSRPIRGDGRKNHGAYSLEGDTHRSLLRGPGRECCSSDLRDLFPSLALVPDPTTLHLDIKLDLRSAQKGPGTNSLEFGDDGAGGWIGLNGPL